MGLGSTSAPDQTARHGSLADRNALVSGFRRWGMQYTVFNDGANDGIFILMYNKNSTIISDNDNWVNRDTFIGDIDIDGNLTIGSAGNLKGIYFGDGDTGIYEVLDDILRFKLGGLDKYTITSGYLEGVTSTRFRISNNSSTATNPVFIMNKTSPLTGVGGVVGEYDVIISGVSALNFNTSLNATFSNYQILTEVTAPVGTPVAGTMLFYADSADSKPKFKNDAGTVFEIGGNSSVTESTVAIISQVNSSGSNMRYLELVFFSDANANLLSQAVSLITLANSELVTAELEVSIIQDDGSSGGSFKVLSAWLKNSVGTLSQIGTTTTVHSQENMPLTPTVVFNNSSGTLRATVSSGSAEMAYCLKAKLLVATIA